MIPDAHKISCPISSKRSAPSTRRVINSKCAGRSSRASNLKSMGVSCYKKETISRFFCVSMSFQWNRTQEWFVCVDGNQASMTTDATSVLGSAGDRRCAPVRRICATALDDSTLLWLRSPWPRRCSCSLSVTSSDLLFKRRLSSKPVAARHFFVFFPSVLSYAQASIWLMACSADWVFVLEPRYFFSSIRPCLNTARKLFPRRMNSFRCIRS